MINNLFVFYVLKGMPAKDRPVFVTMDDELDDDDDSEPSVLTVDG